MDLPKPSASHLPSTLVQVLWSRHEAMRLRELSMKDLVSALGSASHTVSAGSGCPSLCSHFLLSVQIKLLDFNCFELPSGMWT